MLIDSHAHLDMEDFDEDRPLVLERAWQAGLSRIVTVGIDLPGSTRAAALAQGDGRISAAVGCHPHHADTCDARTVEALALMTSEPGVVAWGEIGLDYYRNYAPVPDQRTAFRAQLRAASDLRLPVIIHDREAHAHVLEELTGMGKGERKGVIHCFSGDLELAEAFIALGYLISIPGTVTYKNARLVHEVASSIPLRHMLIETDAPFLTPVPRRGSRNEPAFVALTALEIARRRNIDVEEVAERTTENARTLFALP